ncbi:MAG TPA: response regulator transcription factor [Thermoanaerobaculia bacterium]|nr:response regulator transcription factor [Thermoanaerobaculia bacterium]
MKIAIVDDHPVVREGLVAALARRAELTIVGAFGSAEEFLSAQRRADVSSATVGGRDVRPPDVDVVLLDLELPGMSGVDAIPKIAARVLVLTAYANDEQIDAVLRAGARGYLLKGASVDEIERALRAVAAGDTYLDPRVASRVLALSREPRLSAREREVLKLVASGRSNKEIAAALQIAERTVKFHVTAIFNKLGAENRAQAVAIAHQRGIV